MRFDVKKFLFFGAVEQKEDFFRRAQEVGIIHFVDMPMTKSAAEISEEDTEKVTAEDVAAAIKILRGLPPVDQDAVDDLHTLDPIVERMLFLKEETEKLDEEVRILKLDIARVAPFGDFSLDDIAFIEKEANLKIRFFCAKAGLYHTLDLPEGVVYFASDGILDYFIAFQREPTSYEPLTEVHIPEPLGLLKKRLHDARHQRHEDHVEMLGYARYNEALHQTLLVKLNRAYLDTAQERVGYALDDQLFVIEGWVPVRKLEELKKLTDTLHIYCEEVAADPDEVPPTYLENTGLSRVGEDLIRIYDTPSQTDKDPSLWVLAAFSFFFAIIVGDGGYGIIYLAIALFLHYRYPNVKGVGRRVLKLFTVLAIACIAWGLFTAAYFSMTLDIENPLRKYAPVTWLAEKKMGYYIQHDADEYKQWVKTFPNLKDVKDPYQFLAEGVKVEHGVKTYPILSRLSDNIMMELALLIGVLHITISLLRYSLRNWPSIGWVFFLIGCYLAIPAYLKEITVVQYLFGLDSAMAWDIGLSLIFGGMGLAVLLAIIKNGIIGIMESMNVIQIFADILSYLRLYALGLAGAIVGATINDVTSVLPFIFAFLIILAGHALNMLLGIMGGVVHGLRLNFLEWYHYSFEGGGKPYEPLRLLNKD